MIERLNVEPVSVIVHMDRYLIGSENLSLNAKEEFTELQDAIDQNDFVEVVDALSDMLYVIHGFGRFIGVDLDKAFDIVHTSNMSKSSEDL